MLFDRVVVMDSVLLRFLVRRLEGIKKLKVDGDQVEVQVESHLVESSDNEDAEAWATLLLYVPSRWLEHGKRWSNDVVVRASCVFSARR